MSDEPVVDTPEEPSSDLVEMLAKRLFRSENDDPAVWDTRAIERAGTPLGMVKTSPAKRSRTTIASARTKC